jgi:hypothetical protein
MDISSINVCHSHRRFSAVIGTQTATWKPFKRFLVVDTTRNTGLKPRCE